VEGDRSIPVREAVVAVKIELVALTPAAILPELTKVPAVNVPRTLLTLTVAAVFAAAAVAPAATDLKALAT
jgi:hypothetical protein